MPLAIRLGVIPTVILLVGAGMEWMASPLSNQGGGDQLLSAVAIFGLSLVTAYWLGQGQVTWALGSAATLAAISLALFAWFFHPAVREGRLINTIAEAEVRCADRHFRSDVTPAVEISCLQAQAAEMNLQLNRLKEVDAPAFRFSAFISYVAAALALMWLWAAWNSRDLASNWRSRVGSDE